MPAVLAAWHFSAGSACHSCCHAEDKKVKKDKRDVSASCAAPAFAPIHGIVAACIIDLLSLHVPLGMSPFFLFYTSIYVLMPAMAVMAITDCL